MIQQGTDWGFVGPAYEAPMLLQDAQRCINWYPEVTENRGSKMPIALLGCPGLNPVLSTIPGEVRGMWPLPGAQSALVVVANTLYLMTVQTPATAQTEPIFAATAVGTLLTSTGPVVMRDNGPLFGGEGGFVAIVDGTYGYYYLISGAPQTVTFSGSAATGSPVVALSGDMPYGLVISPGVRVTDSDGGFRGVSIVSVDFNALTITMTVNSTVTNSADTFTVTIPVFGQITDPAFLPASRIAFIEGWLIFSEPGTRTFFTNAATPYTLLFDGGFYALKDSSSDNLMTLFENNRELWLVGERTSEVWYNAGNTNFAFARIPGIGPQIGCAATHSITRIGPNLIWLARNEQGENLVVQTQQYSWERVSNHAVEHAWAQYPVVSDAIGYAYEEDGHFFYVLTFPTADATWVFDGLTNMWHQRASFDPVAGVYHRHRSNCFMDLSDVRLVGDYQSGQVHQMSRQYYTDAGNPLRCQRRAPHVWSSSDRYRIFHGWLQCEFTPGVGLATGQGSNPQAMLRWSNDGGFTWSNEHWTTIGAQGETRNRAIWRRLGRARDRVYELNFSDPTARDLIGVTLMFEPEEQFWNLPDQAY